MTITHVDPPTLRSSPAFAQGVIVEAGRTLYIGGQNGTDRAGIMATGVVEQSAQAARNVIAVLNAAGAHLDDLVKLNIYIVHGEDLEAAYAASLDVWGARRAAVTVLVVAGLARPDALVEIDGVAAL